MFKIKDILIQSNLKSYLKRYKLPLLYSFMIGSIMGSIPFIYKSHESFKVHKLMEEQRKIQIQNKAKICKKENSEYDKFLSLGFPKTAIEKFNICMKEK
tara:strand:+ start:177 stop:473 length:297 start_codon:yes stop_codon:yes gene_type:complete